METPAAPTSIDALVAALYDDRCIQPPQTDHAEHVITALLRNGYRITAAALPVQEPLDVEDVSRVLNQHESDCSYFEGGDFTCSCGYEDAAERVSQWLDRQDPLRDRSTPMTDHPTTEEARHPVRIKVYGGSLRLLPPGSEWRVERITEHQQPSGSIGEPMAEWTLIDLVPHDTSEPAEGDTQRRCWTILGPDPISQCVLYNGHDGEHDFGAHR